MTTTSSSEPLLSEAAYFIMQKESFNAVKALKSILESFWISKDDRRELVLLLLTLAHDAAVGSPDSLGRPLNEKRWFGLSDFLCENVFRVPNAPSNLINKESIKALKDIDKDILDARLHFNHFVKLHEPNAIDIRSLLLLLGRGAGVLCANNQRGIDGVIAFLKGTMLSLENGGSILFQIKNDPLFSHVPKQGPFTAMDPYEPEILELGDAAIPLIKIIFALAAEKPYLDVVRRGQTKDYNAVTYEIWCAGISPDILRLVKDQDIGLWDALFRASYGREDLRSKRA